VVVLVVETFSNIFKGDALQLRTYVKVVLLVVETFSKVE